MAVRDPGGCRRQSGPQKSNAVPELPAAPAVQPVMRRRDWQQSFIISVAPFPSRPGSWTRSGAC